MTLSTKLAIFDLDGTLLDTRDDLAYACNHALEALGYPGHPLQAYNTMVGRGIRNLFRAALPQDRVNGENLDRITKAGVAVALASNKYQEGAELLMARFFPKIRFARILGQREGHPIKPDPGIVFQCMGTVPDIRKEEVVYAGDSDVDMQTGANAGVRTAGVLWGFRTRADLEAYRPWLLAADVPELENALLKEG